MKRVHIEADRDAGYNCCLETLQYFESAAVGVLVLTHLPFPHVLYVFTFCMVTEQLIFV